MGVFSEEDIYRQVRNALLDLFEIEEDQIHPEARLNQDLGLDSIDAIDLIVRLKNIAGIKVRPEEFKDVRTVGDVVRVVNGLVNESHS